MPQKPETRFQNKVLAKLKAVPGLYYVKVQQVSIRGIPDIIGCYNGKFFAFELKVPPNKVKPGSLQEYNLQSIKKAGGLALEVTPQNFEQVLKELIC